MEQTPNSSRRLLLVGLGAAILLILVIAGIAFALFGAKKQDSGNSTTAQSSDQQPATKQDVKKDLDELNASLKQAASDQAAAKAALKDSENQVKVAN